MNRIKSAKPVFQTEWFSLLECAVEGWDKPHYAIETDDYVCCVAVSGDDLILVKQYRPAVKTETWELPAGHVDPGETPEAACRRELLEETGFEARVVHPLCVMYSDVGRNTNRQHCFWTRDLVRVADQGSEKGVECFTVSAARARELIDTDEFGHALHLAALSQAIIKGILP